MERVVLLQRLRPLDHTGLFTRIGVRPNEGTMDVGLSVWLPGGSLAYVNGVREQREMVDTGLSVTPRLLEVALPTDAASTPAPVGPRRPAPSTPTRAVSAEKVTSSERDRPTASSRGRGRGPQRTAPRRSGPLFSGARRSSSRR